MFTDPYTRDIINQITDRMINITNSALSFAVKFFDSYLILFCVDMGVVLGLLKIEREEIIGDTTDLLLSPEDLGL